MHPDAAAGSMAIPSSSGGARPFATFIVCTHNRVRALQACIRSIERACTAHASITSELVVVDNGSTDGTPDELIRIAAASPIAITRVTEPRPGLAAARNAGLEQARGRILVFIDDDCEVDSSYLADLKRHYANGEMRVIRGGRVELGSPSDLPFTIKRSRVAAQLTRDVHPGGFVLGCNMSMHRDVAALVGPFDERFGAGAPLQSAEDTDYLVRAFELGIAVEYVPDMVVHHHHGRRTRAAIEKLHRSYSLGNGGLCLKHLFGAPWLIRHFCWTVRSACTQAFGGARFDPELRLSHWPIVSMNLLGAVKFMCLAATSRLLADRPTPVQADSTRAEKENMRAAMLRFLLPGLHVLRDALGPQLRLLPVVVVLGLASAALEGAGIGLIIPMLSIIAGDGQAGGLSGISAFFQQMGQGLNDGTRLLAIAAAVLSLITLKNVLAFANTLLTNFIYGKASHAIRSALSDQLLRIGYPFFMQQNPGRLLNIISNESWRASDAIQTVLASIVHGSATVILMAFLLLLSWQMTLFVALGLVLVQLAHAALSATLKRPSRDVTSFNSELAGRMLHLVHAGRLIRVFGQEQREKNAFDAASEAVRRAGFVLQTRQGVLPPLTEVLHSALFLAAVVSAWFVGVSFPVIVAFVILLYRLQPHVRALQMSWSQIQGWSGSLEEVRWLLDSSDKPKPPTGSEPFEGLRRAIQFDRVTFRYPGSEERPIVLRSAGFQIHHGRSTAIIGRSGAGKTTIVNLLCRFVEPDEGRILVDGVPLDEIDPVQWRRQIAVASQDLELVDGSILENITYGQSATFAEVERAAKLAEAHSFIEKLPQGYETVVGYRGASLSAGQRQRIALARALVRDPAILILDEATNAVDGLSEAAIVETLKSRAGRRTTVVISHHRSTISFCDDVVVLGSGRVKSQMRLAEVASLSMDQLYEHEIHMERQG